MGRGGGSGHSSGGSHRSSGSGHSRSFGGSSSHASRGGASRGGSSFHSSSRSGYHSSSYGTPSRPPRRSYYSGYGGNYGGNSSSVISSLVITVILIVVLCLMVPIFVQNTGKRSDNITKSTVEREALKPYAAFDKYCIDDNAGWITDKKTLLRGMEEFYKKTGVQPALAIYEEINGEKYLSSSDIEDFAYDEYDLIIGHERGILLLFCEYAESDYYVYYMAGEDAQTVMDGEACDILVDYVHDLYVGDYSDEEYFAAVFEKTADRIMNVTPTVSSKIPVIVFGIVIIAVLVTIVILVKQKHKRDAERAAETERILNSSIDRL